MSETSWIVVGVWVGLISFTMLGLTIINLLSNWVDCLRNDIKAVNEHLDNVAVSGELRIRQEGKDAK